MFTIIIDDTAYSPFFLDSKLLGFLKLPVLTQGVLYDSVNSIIVWAYHVIVYSLS